MDKTASHYRLKMMGLTIGGFFISCSFVLLLLPAFVFFGLLSWGVYFILKVKYGDKITRAGGLDVMQGIESKKSRPYINAIARYHGEFPIDNLKKLMMKKGILYKDDNGNRPFRRYQQRMEKHLGYHIFKDHDQFDINNHIIPVTKEDLFAEEPYLMESNFLNEDTLPENIKNKYGVQDTWQLVLQFMMKKYGHRPVSKDIPRWEIIFFSESKTKTTTLFRIHHSITDGIYFLRFLLESLGDRAVEYRLPYNYHQPNFIKRMYEGFMAFCLVPFGIYRLCTLLSKNPLHGPPLTGKKIYLVAKSISLENLKEVKTLTKASVNTVLFSCLSYALKCRFREKQASVDNTVIVVPISLQDLRKPISTKNCFGLQGVVIPTTEIDPEMDCALMRLQQVSEKVMESKQDPSFLPIHWLIKYTNSLLPSSIVKYLITTRGLTSSLSNVAGPQEESLYICGNEQIDMAFWVPDRDPLGMGVSITGHRGRIRVGIMVDEALISSPNEAYSLLADFLGELKTLRKELHLIEMD